MSTAQSLAALRWAAARHERDALKLEVHERMARVDELEKRMDEQATLLMQNVSDAHYLTDYGIVAVRTIGNVKVFILPHIDAREESMPAELFQVTESVPTRPDEHASIGTLCGTVESR